MLHSCSLTSISSLQRQRTRHLRNMNRFLTFLRYFSYCFGSLALTIGICFSLLIAVASIPKDRIEENIKKSAEYLYTTQQLDLPVRLTRDNFTDSIMLNIAYCIDEDTPVTSALENKLYMLKDPEEGHRSLHYLLNGGEKLYKWTYFRYWHGYLVVLRPLLTIFDYPTIRYVNYIMFSTILIWLLYLTKKRFSTGTMWVLLLAMAYASAFFIPQSIQYSTTFYISILASILIITTFSHIIKPLTLSCIFTAVGALTSFSDFLVTPVVTLGFPLSFLLLSIQDRNIREQLKLAVMLSAAWSFGYVGMWATKWISGTLLLEHNIITDALNQLATRSIGTFPFNYRMTCSRIFWFLPDYGKLWWACIFLATLLTLTSMLYGLYRYNRKSFLQHIALLFVAMIPVLWSFMAFNHTMIHLFYVNRMYSVSIFTLGMFAIKILTDKKSAKVIN